MFGNWKTSSKGWRSSAPPVRLGWLMWSARPAANASLTPQLPATDLRQHCRRWSASTSCEFCRRRRGTNLKQLGRWELNERRFMRRRGAWELIFRRTSDEGFLGKLGTSWNIFVSALGEAQSAVAGADRIDQPEPSSPLELSGRDHEPQAGGFLFPLAGQPADIQECGSCHD